MGNYSTSDGQKGGLILGKGIHSIDLFRPEYPGYSPSSRNLTRLESVDGATIVSTSNKGIKSIEYLAHLGIAFSIHTNTDLPTLENVGHEYGAVFVVKREDGELQSAETILCESELVTRLVMKVNPLASRIFSNPVILGTLAPGMNKKLHALLGVEYVPEPVTEFEINEEEIRSLRGDVDTMNTFVREHGNLIREFLRAIDEGEALLDVNEPYVALVLQGMIRALITLPPHYTSAINEVLREFDGLAASMIFPLEDDTFKGVFVDGKWYREPEETRYPIASNAPLSKELEWEIDRLSGQIHSEMSGVAIGRKESATRALLEGAALRLMREPDMAYEDFVDVLTELKHQGLLLVAHEVGCTYDSETQSWEYPKDRTDHTGIKTQEILHGMRPDLFDAPVYPDSGPSFGRDFS